MEVVRIPLLVQSRYESDVREEVANPTIPLEEVSDSPPTNIYVEKYY